MIYYIAQPPTPSGVNSETILAPFTTASGWAIQVSGGILALTAVAALLGFLLRKYSS